jgi:hypothetical protein
VPDKTNSRGVSGVGGRDFAKARKKIAARGRKNEKAADFSAALLFPL